MHAALVASLLLVAGAPPAPARADAPWAGSVVLVGNLDDEGRFVATSNGVVVGAGGEVVTLRSALAGDAPVWAVDASGARHAVTARDDRQGALGRLVVPTLPARAVPLRGRPRLGDEVTVLGAALLEAPRETRGRIVAIVDDEQGATLRIDAALPPAGTASLVLDEGGAPIALAIDVVVQDGQPVVRAKPLRALKRHARRPAKKGAPAEPVAPVGVPLLAPLPRADHERLQKLSDASLAVALENEGDGELLELHLDAALRWNPLSAAPWIRLARHLDGEGRWTEAQQAYEAAAVLPGDHRQAHCALAALTLHKRGVHDRAEALARRCLAAEPGHSLSLAVLGAALAGNGNGDAALPLLQEATTKDPSLGWAHGVIGAMRHEAGDLEGAVIAYRKGIRATPKSASLRLALGDAQLARGVPERALRAFRAAGALDPESAVIASRVGDALAALGRKGEAKAAYRRALSIDPKLDGVEARLQALSR